MAALKYEPVLVSSAVRAALAALIGVGLLTAGDVDVEKIVAVFAAGGVVETTIGFLTRRKTRSKRSLRDQLDWRAPVE